MKRALIIVFLLAAPLHGRLTRHNFSFMLTGSLGLIGEYTNADPINQSPHHFPIDEDPLGRGVPLPASMAASGAFGLEFAYMWIPIQVDFIGFELHLGFRLTDMPYFWQGGSYLIQPYGGLTVMFTPETPKASLMIDGIGFSAGGMLGGDSGPFSRPTSIAIILPLGIQVQFKNLRLSLRHELEFVRGYRWLAQGQPAAYRQGEAWKYNLILGLGWGFGISEKGVFQ